MTVPKTTNKPIQLFISYSHIDEKHLERLKTSLAGLKRQGLIEEWHDRKIVAGQEWDKVIDEKLNTAHIILLLVTPDFMNSQYVSEKEIERAIERHEQGEARVIPIIVRPADWEWAPFAFLQALPRNGKPITKWPSRDDAWMDVAKGIRKAVREVTGGTPSPPTGSAEQVPIDRYREAVESIWKGGQLTEQEVRWLHVYANKELRLSASKISSIECEVMGATKEAMLERQEHAAEEEYRRAVEEAWIDATLSDAEMHMLNTLVSKLGLRTDRATQIEHEVTGDTAQAVYERQTRELEERKRLHDSLYGRARRLHQEGEWQAVVDTINQIRELNPEYHDREDLFESASEALLEQDRRVAAAYDLGLQRLEAEDWQRALECFEEVQRLKPGYRDTDNLISQARHTLTAGTLSYSTGSQLAAPWEYVDFKLEVNEEIEPRKYPVIVHSPEGESQGEMRFPFDEWQLKDRLRDLEVALLRSSGSRRNISAEEERAVQDFGRTLFEALLTGEVRERYEAKILEAKKQNKGLRLKLHIRAPELAALPWEFLYDPAREYLVLSSKTPLVRYLDVSQPVERLRVTPPLRILGMAASPTGSVQLDIEHEKRLVEEATKDLRADGVVELTWMEGQRWRDLQRMMRRGEWHIFHFVGHGDFDSASGASAIAFSDDQGRKHLLEAKRLGRLLDDHDSLRLVFLNSCEGARGSERDALSSAAATLVSRGIPAVVAMQYEVTDRAAIEFSRSFYEAVADGLPVDAAVAEARTAVSMESLLEWGTPVLYMRSPDGHIFDIQQTREQTREPRRQLDSLYGRARRLHQEGEWQAVVDTINQIRELNPEYHDREDLFESASEALLEQDRRVAAAYDLGLQRLEAEDWQRALECFEEVQRLKPGYRDTDNLISQARHALTEYPKGEPKLDKVPLPGWEPKSEPSSPPAVQESTPEPPPPGW